MRKFLFLSGLLAFVAPFISCSGLSEAESTASLVINLPSSAREAWYDDISAYSVSVSSSSNPVNGSESLPYSNTKEAFPGESIEFEEVPAGVYDIEVLAKNANLALIGKGSANATVKAGEFTKVSITVKKYSAGDEGQGSDQSGTGGLGVDVDVDKGDEGQQESGTEITYDGKVSFNNTEYATLAEALNAAAQTELSSVAHTITLTGNIKANLLTSAETDEATGEATGLYPWKIGENLIIDLNGNTLYWSEFTADDYNTAENPLFQVGSGHTLLIKNGTITSESGMEHKNILLGTMGGTIVLQDVEIKDVVAPYILSIMANSNSSARGALYTENVTIEDCQSNNTTGSGIPISVSTSDFYALNTSILNVLGTSVSVAVTNGTEGSFVGGTIALTSENTLSQADAAGDRDSVLLVANSTTSFTLASSTVYSNTAVHGIPIKLTDSASLNLAKGFKFKKFNTGRFAASFVDDEAYISADNAALGLKIEENAIAAAQSSEITKSTDSTETVFYVGTSPSTPGFLYISGNSSIYGVVQLYLYSAIAQTGKFETENVIKVDFGATMTQYQNLTDGNYPLYWAGGQETDDSKFELDKFELYISNDYAVETEYVIGDSGRKTNEYAGDNAGNTIYAPIIKE
ncbi:MAG: hypothetical protein IJ257_04680 [Treponema sp.]|nr:hypothetical protein [Treponema sp.]